MTNPQGLQSISVAEILLSGIFSDTLKKLILVESKKYRFVLARVVIPNKEAKDQRIYIRYQAYSEPDQKVRPFKVYLIDQYRNHPEFDKIAERLCQEINKLLIAGCHYNPNKVAIQEITKPELAKKRKNTEPTLLSALSVVLVNKSVYKLNTYNTYKKAFTQLEKYLQIIRQTEWLISELSENDARGYSHYMLKSKEVSNRTHNNNINALITMWNDLIEMKMVKSNPWKKVNKPSSGRGRNLAFTPIQQKELLDFMDEKWPAIAFLCRFMYYTGCRSNELAHLKIKDIYLMGDDKIHVDRKWAKSSSMRLVVVHPRLAQLIEERKLKDYPGEHYIFGTEYLPNKKCRDGRYLAHHFQKKVLTPLNYDKNYTLYSWRHTFAVMGHINGMNIAEIGMQLGHMDTQSTNTYLKSLGCFDNNAVKEKLPII